MGGTCSTYGENSGVYRVLVGNPAGKNHVENPGVDGSIILIWIFRIWYVGGMDWNDVAQDSDKWRALANAVMNLRVP